jgi:starch phosphorylase
MPTRTTTRPTADSEPLDLIGLIRKHTTETVVNFWERLLPHERFRSVASAMRERLAQIGLATNERYRKAGAKTVWYLSMEFLIGRSLANNLVNLGLYEQATAALRELGHDLGEVLEAEPDAALGNGGLGRLAACFLDSLASLGMPAWGCGLLYEYGLFRQEIHDSRQIERPDNWLTFGCPWLVERPERAVPMRLYGRVVNGANGGGYRPQWADAVHVLGIPHDLPIVGYGGHTTNPLRLFSARAPHQFDMHAFNEGQYLQAVSDETRVEVIHKVLYPNDAVARGPELRLVQEYFLVACALHTLLEQYDVAGGGKDYTRLPDKVAIQLNDTHPALAVAELMRLLVDEKHIGWDEAWKITVAICGYTNHTLMPEALEKWPVALMERVLPRHLEIIYEINRRHLENVTRSFPGDLGKVQRMSLIEEGPNRFVRMANLAIVGSHSVNGVAAVHSELVKTKLVPDFYALTPGKFNNKTNGVTPRRWLRLCNPALAALICEAVGDAWIADLSRLRELERFAEDASFCDRFLRIKAQNKRTLSGYLHHEGGLDEATLLDTQVKRIHLYKRQLLNVLRVVHDYLRLVEDGARPVVPRTYLFAGKAAPGYRAAKEVIYLINRLADLIDHEPKAKGMLRLVFARDYRVTLAERIIPAADLSEQISTAGMEASGTSNMKFAMNGALTVGTLDGANIEIREEVGADNIFIFGNTVKQVEQLQAEGVRPRRLYEQSPTIRRILDAFHGGRLSPKSPGEFEWVFRTLVEEWDPYFHLADLEAYLAVEEQAGRLYANPRAWARKAILNVARMGKFSSDRTITEYARDIWKIAPVLD